MFISFFASNRNVLSCVFNRWIGFHREWRKRVSNLWTNGIVRFVEYLLFAFSLPSLLVTSLFAVLALVRTEHWLSVIWLLFYCLNISNLIQCFFSPVSAPIILSSLSVPTLTFLRYYVLLNSIISFLNFWRQEIPLALVVALILREFWWKFEHFDENFVRNSQIRPFFVCLSLCIVFHSSVVFPRDCTYASFCAGPFESQAYLQ